MSVHTVPPPPPGHSLPPVGQPHLPALQNSPAAHGVPHAPQLRGSLDVSVHRPPQIVPLVQVHAPETHVSTALHPRTHDPQ